MLNNLPLPVPTLPSTPQNIRNTADLDLSVLKSSPPDGTELRQANAVFHRALESNESPASPTRRYAKRMTALLDTQNAKFSIIQKELSECRELLQIRKMRTKGKRIKLQGEFVFSTAEVLKIVQEAEAIRTVKRPRGRPRKRPIEEFEVGIEEEEVELSSEEFEVDLDECVARRTRSKLNN